MKFAQLHLKAFGPFRDRVLELPVDSGRDLHLIYGPNEAGKSSTLRAVTGFLFGIPARTADAFLHDYSELRVGATLSLPQGERLSVMRRKGNKNTLFAFDETTGMEITTTPLAENTLTDLLGGLDEGLYQTLFGLDLNGLHEGSEELLRGEGEVGRSLFQAATGLASLRSLMEGLDKQAAETFKARGQTLPLNRALQEFEAQRRELKERTVRSSTWEKAASDYRRAAEHHATLREHLVTTRATQQRLDRLRVNLPLLAERAQVEVALAGLAGIPALPIEAREHRVAAEERLRGAEQARASAESGAARLAAAVVALVIGEPLLAQAGAVEQVFHALDAYRVARTALPATERQIDELDTRVTRLLAELKVPLDLAVAASLLPSATLRAGVQSLLDEDARLAERDLHLASQRDEQQVTHERLVARLAQLPASTPVDMLEQSRARMANIPDLETRRRLLAREVGELEAELRDGLATLWPGSLAELLSLTVPLPAMANGFEAEFAALAQHEHALDQQAAILERDLAECVRELAGWAAGGEVVTQAEVVSARSARDAQWASLRGAWQDAHARPLAPALVNDFEAALREADRLADLLHADTARATHVAATRKRVLDMEGARARQAESRAGRVADRAALDARWAALTAPLRRSELSPAALRDWLSLHGQMLARHAELEKLRQAERELEHELMRARQSLDGALETCALPSIAANESLAEALDRVRLAVSAARRASSERTALGEQLGTQRVELARLEAQRAQYAQRRAAWQAQWDDATARLRLGGNALAAEVKVRLEQFTRLAADLDEAARLAATAAAQRSVVAEFELRVAQLAAAVEASDAGRAPDALAERLYEDLGATRAAQARRQQLTGEIEAARRAQSEAEMIAREAHERLAELLVQAGCASAVELPALEDQALLRRELNARLADLDTQLLRHNARPVAEVLSEAEGYSLDQIATQIDEAMTRIDDLEREVDAAQETLFTTKRDLDAIDGGADGAEAQQAARALAARIASEARTYARLRLAHGVLGRVVQTYRARHQGPLLARAAQIFRRITLDSFTDLAVDWVDDSQVLLGERADRSRVPIAGMSQGTRDQLFLALRLSAIEQHVASRGPFPVIVDDLLVQFDDARALATLDVLAELATRTQVLFFTHHQHLVTLTEAAPIAQTIGIQSL